MTKDPFGAARRSGSSRRTSTRDRRGRDGSSAAQTAAGAASRPRSRRPRPRSRRSGRRADELAPRGQGARGAASTCAAPRPTARARCVEHRRRRRRRTRRAPHRRHRRPRHVTSAPSCRRRHGRSRNARPQLRAQRADLAADDRQSLAPLQELLQKQLTGRERRVRQGERSRSTSDARSGVEPDVADRRVACARSTGSSCSPTTSGAPRPGGRVHMGIDMPALDRHARGRGGRRVHASRRRAAPAATARGSPASTTSPTTTRTSPTTRVRERLVTAGDVIGYVGIDRRCHRPAPPLRGAPGCPARRRRSIRSRCCLGLCAEETSTATRVTSPPSPGWRNLADAIGSKPIVLGHVGSNPTPGTRSAHQHRVPARACGFESHSGHAGAARPIDRASVDRGVSSTLERHLFGGGATSGHSGMPCLVIVRPVSLRGAGAS